MSIIRDLVRSFTGCSRLVRLTYVHSDLAGAESITYSYLRRKCNLVQALRFCTGHTAHSGSRGIALHNEELNDLYSLPNIVRVVKSRRMRWAGHVARMEEDRGVHRVLVGKPGGKRPLGRPRRRWDDNIKMDLQEVGGGRGDWMELAQDRDGWRALVGTVRNFRVP